MTKIKERAKNKGQKSKGKISDTLIMKRVFKAKQKYCQSFLKGFQLPEIVSGLRVSL